MNKLFLGLVFFISVNALAQDSTATKNDKPALFYLFQNNYSLASKYNDELSARNALYNMISLDPYNDSLRFTLAFSYYEARQFPSAILTCMDVIAQNPQHAGALEMSAIGYEEIGLKDKALTNYEKLYMVTEDILTLYKVAFVQYELERYQECAVNIDILLNDSTVESQRIILQLSEEEEKEYVMKVPILNLRGLVKKAQGDTKGAAEDFKAALALAPDYTFAKTNLEELDK